MREICRKDIAAYVEHMQDRGLKMTSVKNHLHTVYAFIQYLVDNEILPLDILHKKIRIKLPEVLPRAIPAEDMQHILAGIENVRDRALILLLLHTGMRIGKLLRVKMADIIQPERKILCKVFAASVIHMDPSATAIRSKALIVGSIALFSRASRSLSLCNDQGDSAV